MFWLFEDYLLRVKNDGHGSILHRKCDYLNLKLQTSKIQVMLHQYDHLHIYHLSFIFPGIIFLKNVQVPLVNSSAQNYLLPNQFWFGIQICYIKANGQSYIDPVYHRNSIQPNHFRPNLHFKLRAVHFLIIF